MSAHNHPKYVRAFNLARVGIGIQPNARACLITLTPSCAGILLAIFLRLCRAQRHFFLLRSPHKASAARLQVLWGLGAYRQPSKPRLDSRWHRVS